MAPPPYHLRPNKAIDRFLFIETIRQLITPQEIKNYIYHGFGGPYLDDFKLLHELFPDLEMVSIEENEQTYKRQKFHKPFTGIKLVNDTLHSFLNAYSPIKKIGIFWLDYTKLDYPQFEEFMLAVSKGLPGSIIRITLQAHPKDYKNNHEDFQDRFEEVLPSPTTTPPSRMESYCELLQEMVSIAAQKSLPVSTGLIFQPLSSFYYKDGVGMFTLTGMISTVDHSEAIKEKLKKWPFAMLNWEDKPKEINVPTLSTKERLHLQKYLPSKRKNLSKVLGYLIDGKFSEDQMSQYAEFYRQYPYFIRVMP